jgi:hypothetical protein
VIATARTATPSSDVLAPWAYGIGRSSLNHPGKMDTLRGSSVLSAEIAWIMSLSSASSIFVTCSAAIEKYYNAVRPRLALEKNAPIPRDTHRAGRVLSLPILGGLQLRSRQGIEFACTAISQTLGIQQTPLKWGLPPSGFSLNGRLGLRLVADWGRGSIIRRPPSKPCPSPAGPPLSPAQHRAC